MKCIHCRKDSRYQDRRNGKCSQCGHEFAFEPKTNSYRLTDLRFQSALNEVSAKQTRYFTSLQFGYALDRAIRKRGSNVGCFAIVIFVVAAGVTMWASDEVLLAVLIASLAAVVVLLAERAFRAAWPKQATLTFGDSVSLFRRWEQTNGEVTNLLPSTEFSSSKETVPEGLESFDDDYLLARALVTDTADISHMLVMNGFHITDNCAILSVDGYPVESFDKIMTVLRKTPELEVYALHNASVAGCMLPLTLRTENWFPDDDVRIVDLGLRPNHVGLLRVTANQGMLKHVLRNLGGWRVGQLSNAVVIQGARQAVPIGLNQVLTQAELRWLEKGNSVELAFMSPERLMKAIRGALWRRDQFGLAEDDGGFWRIVRESDFGDDGNGDGDGDSGFG